MPSLDEILRYFAGAWRMMNGRADGLRAFDISADGFWASFFAIPVALPALFVGWVAVATELGREPAIWGNPGSIIARLAVVDIASWVLPLAGLAFAARPAGIAGRFAHYVIASNWGAALLVWAMLPVSVLRLAAGESEAATLLTVVLFLLTLVLSWRLTNVAIAKGPGVATGVFSAVLFSSLLVLFTLQALFGLTV
jgi:hypothetical protein